MANFHHIVLRVAGRGHIDILELLLPKNIPGLTNAKSTNGGWSSLHFAAAYNQVSIVEWLCDARMADLHVQDEEGNTPLHLAVVFGHKDVVWNLVTRGADISILNSAKMMPISFCTDTSMFETLFSADTVYLDIGKRTAESDNRTAESDKRTAESEKAVVWPSDACHRTILHYAAQFARDPKAVAILIAHMDSKQLHDTDEAEESFLHVAAKSGNMSILESLHRLAAVHIDVPYTFGGDPLQSPGLYALLHNHRNFFDEFTTMSQVEITLRCIIKGLKAELKNDSYIQDKLDLFASTLPTYLALYANKDCIFKFLLETNLISLSQWDDEHKRTCLHWAVLDKRADIIEKLCAYAQLSPGIQDRDGKTALQHAFEQNNHLVMDILRGRPDFKEYEEKLYRDRDVYVQALNAILVGAALIASVTFTGWLQWPPTAEFNSWSMKFFWTSNSISFFTASATMCVTTAALLPASNRSVGDTVKTLRVAIVMDAGLLALSLAAVMCAFASVGFAAIDGSHISAYQVMMKFTVAVGGCLAAIMWLAFVRRVCKCTTPKSLLVSLALPRRFCWWLPVERQPQWALAADSSSANLGYRSLSRRELEVLLDQDLVAIQRSFNREDHNKKEDKRTVLQIRREEASAHIISKFGHDKQR